MVASIENSKGKAVDHGRNLANEGKRDALKDVSIEAQLQEDSLTMHFNGENARFSSPIESQSRRKGVASWVAAEIRALISEVTRSRLLGTICIWRISVATRSGTTSLFRSSLLPWFCDGRTCSLERKR